jgi:hypothetical protein
VAGPDAFDAGQWRALVLASLRNDLRRSGRSAGLAGGGRSRGFGTLILLNLLVGAMLSIPLWVGMPVFPVAVLHLTYLMLSVAALLVLDGHGLIVSPADYAVVAPRPVSGRTFFAARVSTLLVYVFVVAGAQSAFPLVSYFAAGGLHLGRGTLGLVSMLVTTLTTAAVTISFYAAVLRHAPAAQLRAVLTALQLTTSFGLYGLLVLLPSEIGRAYLLGPLAAGPKWLWLVPSAWAASLIDVGHRGWLLAPLALAVPVVAWTSAARWLSIGYAEQVAAANALPDLDAGKRVAPRFRKFEAQAVALVARAQFRNDMRFRLAVLGIVPLTIIYLLLGIVDEDLARGSQGHPAMVYVAVLLFPVLLKTAFARTDAYRAAWVFYATPASAGRLLLGLRTVVVRWFLGPYVAAIGLLLAFMLPSIGEAVVAVAVVSLLSHVLLLLVLFVDPELPFSSPPQVGSNTRGILVAVIPAVFVGQLLPRTLTWLSASPGLATGTILALLALNVGMDRLLRRRVDRLAARVEFAA